MKEAYEKRNKEIRNAVRAQVIMVMVALHESGYAEAVKWIALTIVALAFVAYMAAVFEPAAGRSMGRWHARNKKYDPSMASNAWYEAAWKEEVEKREGAGE